MVLFGEFGWILVNFGEFFVCFLFVFCLFFVYFSFIFLTSTSPVGQSVNFYFI